MVQEAIGKHIQAKRLWASTFGGHTASDDDDMKPSPSFSIPPWLLNAKPPTSRSPFSSGNYRAKNVEVGVWGIVRWMCSRSSVLYDLSGLVLNDV